MGARKRIKAEAMKEARKKIAFAKLNNCPTSPRKMRLIADLIRGMDADKALAELKLNPKRLQVEWKNFYYQLWQIGKLKMKVKEWMRLTFMYQKLELIVVEC